MTTSTSTGQVLRVGTRGSALALAQSGTVAAQLTKASGTTAELVRVRTEGDVNLGDLATIGGTGVFVTGVRARLLAGEVDVIVHSLKDLPTAPAPGITLAAVPRREDPSDALCARDGLTLATLPAGAVVGTGSPRRAAQILHHRPDIVIRPVRGNVDTRLALVSSGAVDAVVLAMAGLVRLDRIAAVTEIFSVEVMLPAPAQGALALECRTDDFETAWYHEALVALDDPESRAAITCERALLAELEAGCSAPVGALATVSEGQLHLRAAVIGPGGSAFVPGRLSGSLTEATGLGQELARVMLAGGAADVLGAIDHGPPPASQSPTTRGLSSNQRPSSAPGDSSRQGASSNQRPSSAPGDSSRQGASSNHRPLSPPGDSSRQGASSNQRPSSAPN